MLNLLIRYHSLSVLFRSLGQSHSGLIILKITVHKVITGSDAFLMLLVLCLVELLFLIDSRIRRTYQFLLINWIELKNFFCQLRFHVVVTG